jgi:hypothetical protein
MTKAFNPEPENRLPDITLSGEVVEKIRMFLNAPVIFAKAQDGSMRPFVDPLPIDQIFQQAISHAMNALASGGGDSD